MGYDFHKLKTIRCGPIELRVPERWQVNGTEEDGWYCDEDNDEETGTLWITCFRDNSPKKVGFSPRAAVEQLITLQTKDAFPSPQASTLTEDDGKFLWTYFFDSDDRSERIRNLFQTIFIISSTYLRFLCKYNNENNYFNMISEITQKLSKKNIFFIKIYLIKSNDLRKVYKSQSNKQKTWHKLFQALEI